MLVIPTLLGIKFEIGSVDGVKPVRILSVAAWIRRGDEDGPVEIGPDRALVEGKVNSGSSLRHYDEVEKIEVWDGEGWYGAVELDVLRFGTRNFKDIYSVHPVDNEE